MKTAHLLKRAVEASTVALSKAGENGGDDDGKVVVQIPPWAFLLFAITLILVGFVWVSISYTLEEVIATLTMVETPMAAIRLDDTAADPLTKPVDEPQGLANIPSESSPKPVTRKIRTTIQHIVAQGGTWARWRGFRMFLVYSVGTGIVNSFLSFVMPIPGLSSFISIVLLAPVHAGWTHAVIAAPSQKSWWARILPRSSYRALIAPTLVYAASQVLLGFILIGLHFAAETHDDASLPHTVARPFLATVVYILVALFVVLPAAVTLARVEASLLPAEEDTVVPFDRTFGGKVEPKELGGTGALSLVDAWGTFDWEARRRLIKLYAKIFAIDIAFSVAVAFVIVGEGMLVLGESEFKNAAHAGMGYVRDLKKF